MATLGAEALEYIDRTSPTGQESPGLCKDARTRRAVEAANYARFQNLMYALAAAATAALIIAIGLAVFGQPTEAIGSAIGGLVTGAAAVFVRNERNKAQKNELEAWGEVKKYCKEVASLDETAHLTFKH